MSITLRCDRCRNDATPAKNKANIMGVGLVTYNYEDGYSGLRKTVAGNLVFEDDAMLCGGCRDRLRKVVADFMTMLE